MEILTQYGIYLGYSLIAILLLLVMNIALNFKAKDYYSADDELNKGNLAVGFRRAGAYLGLTIAVVGVMYGDSDDSLAKDMVYTLIYGVLGVIFMIVALLSADKVLIGGIDNKKAIKDGNVSVGIIEFGVLVATGIIASAAIKLDDGVFYYSIAYFLVGQVALFLIISIYSLRMKNLLNLKTAISANNKSVGIYIAGKFIAYSLLLHASIYNIDINSTLLTQMASLAIGLLCALVLMSIIEVLVDKIILTKVTVKQLLIEDVYTQSMQLSFIKIGMALILSFTIL